MKNELKDYCRPSEILERWPAIKKHWTANDIGYMFLRLKIIAGKKLKRGCWVSEKDVLTLYREKFCGIIPGAVPSR